jgi:CBS domain-containing protein
METAEILIREAMTKNVITISGDVPVSEAARIMGKNNIGSLVVVEGKSPVGIVTERDITYRVVALDKKPSAVKASEIMSKPVETIGPETTITEASKIMARQNLRRLPVIENDKLLGIITNKDIVQIAPGQIEILRELSRMRDRTSGSETLEKGTCENCGDHGVMLYEVNSSFVCDSCRDDIVGGE